MLEWDDLVLVGRISRPHGLRGDVIVTADTDFVEERFAEGATLWTRSEGGTEPLVIASARLQGARPVVRFQGCERIEDAERLAGLELRVPEDVLQALPEGVYYQHQLIGCVVQTASGDRIGDVARVEGGAAGSLLVVNGTNGEILIPLAADICTSVDPGNKRITIVPPEGLLELNEPNAARKSRIVKPAS